MFIKDLKKLNISFDKIICSSDIRKEKKFINFSHKIFSKQTQIINSLKNNFNLEYKKKFLRYSYKEYYKYTWNIECFVRWYLTDIKYEVFVNNYLTYPFGSFFISSYIYKTFFNKIPPKALRCEFIRYKKIHDLYFQLLESDDFKKILLLNIYKADYLNSSFLIKILKNKKKKYKEKSLYDIFYFLSFFSIEDTSSKNFMDYLRENFSICEKRVIKELLSKSILFKNEILYRNIKYNRNIFATKFFVINGRKIINLKNKYGDDYILFSKNLKNQILLGLKKENIINLNLFLYNNEKGISISRYLFLKNLNKVKWLKV